MCGLSSSAAISKLELCCSQEAQRFGRRQPQRFHSSRCQSRRNCHSHWHAVRQCRRPRALPDGIPPPSTYASTYWLGRWRCVRQLRLLHASGPPVWVQPDRLAPNTGKQPQGTPIRPSTDHCLCSLSRRGGTRRHLSIRTRQAQRPAGWRHWQQWSHFHTSGCFHASSQASHVRPRAAAFSGVVSSWWKQRLTYEEFCMISGLDADESIRYALRYRPQCQIERLERLCL